MPITLGTISSGEVTPFPLTLVDTISTFSDFTTYTFSNITLGSESSDRVLFIGISGIGNNTIGAATVSAVTVGGVSATKRLERSDIASDGSKTVAALFTLPYPTGTLSNVAVTFTSMRQGMAATIFAGTKVQSLVPTATTSFFHTTGITSTTVNLNVRGGGNIIGISSLFSIFGTVWTGLTRSYNGNNMSSANSGFSRSQTATVGYAQAVDSSVILAAFK